MNEALNKGFSLYGCPLTIPYIRGRKMRYTHRLLVRVVVPKKEVSFREAP